MNATWQPPRSAAIEDLPNRRYPVFLDNEQIATYQARLLELRQEHRDLDDAIMRLAEAAYVDSLQLRRLKKRKLQLRDAIAQIESLLIPDEPA